MALNCGQTLHNSRYCGSMEPLGRLRVEQWQVLRQLTAGRRTTSQIARSLGRRSDSVSRGLKTLEGRGLVQLEDEALHTSPGQPGGWWTLTAAGVDAAERAPAPPADTPGTSVPQRSDDERRAPDSLDGGDEPSPGLPMLNRHQTYVTATVESRRVPDLLG